MSVANRKLCPGHPPYGCTTLIDPAKPLCQFCSRTQELADKQALEAKLVKAQTQVRRAQDRLSKAESAVLMKPQVITVTPDAPPPGRREFVDRPVFGQPNTLRPIVETVEIIREEIMPTCPCGGMADGIQHEQSMLHRQFMVGRGPRPSEVRRTHWPKGANQ